MRLQGTVADSGTAPAVASTRGVTRDLDYLAASLHGRRSRMAEKERLDGLCRIGSLQEFFRAVFPAFELDTLSDFQRRCVNELVWEISGFGVHMSGPGADLVGWTLVRFQVEDLKVLIRACLKKIPLEEAYRHLVALPKELALNIRSLAGAESPEDFVRLVPKGLFRESLKKALEIYRDYPRPFFLEAALDCGYFQGLMGRMESLPRGDRECVRALVCQEVDILHLMLVTRGKFHYGLTREMLLPLHVEGTRIPRALFTTMLDDPDLNTAAGRATGRVLDAVPFQDGTKDGLMAIDGPALEGLAWSRFSRLANLAFRQSHMGLGAVMGYVGLRRVEVANLITISEAIRSGMAAEKIRERLLPRNAEGAYV